MITQRRGIVHVDEESLTLLSELPTGLVANSRAIFYGLSFLMISLALPFAHGHVHGLLVVAGVFLMLFGMYSKRFSYQLIIRPEKRHLFYWFYIPWLLVVTFLYLSLMSRYFAHSLLFLSLPSSSAARASAPGRKRKSFSSAVTFDDLLLCCLRWASIAPRSGR